MPASPSSAAFIAAFATIYVVWGSTYLGMRVAVETLPPFLVAGARFLTAGLLLAALVIRPGVQWPTRRQWFDNALIGFCLLLGGNGLVAWAVQYIPSGITALLIGVSPLFFVLIEWAWPGGHRPGFMTCAGLLLGFFGVAWLAAPWETATQGGYHAGGLAALLVATISWSFGSIYGRHVRTPAPLFVASSLQMIMGGVFLLVLSLARGEVHGFTLTQVSARSWWAFGYLVLIGSLVGFSTFVWLMKHSTPARVATYAYVNPVVALFLGWWLLDEPISRRSLVAAAIIVTAVVIITTQKGRSGSAKLPARATRREAAALHARQTDRGE